jgi:simple sugar transport system permease protein
MIFMALIAAGLILIGGLPPPTYFFSELASRVFRRAFFVISLIIPVISGQGLNFGIEIGALAGSLAMTFFCYYVMGGIGTLLLCFLLSVPLAALFGWLTGKYFNKVRGGELVASLFIGFFSRGIVTLTLLNIFGRLIPLDPLNPITIAMDDKNPATIKGGGIRGAIDLRSYESGGLTHTLDNLIRIPFMAFILLASISALAYVIVKYLVDRKKPGYEAGNPWKFRFICLFCATLVTFSLVNIITNSALMLVERVPLVTVLVILALCYFITFLKKTKLGQDLRVVGLNEHVAVVFGIDVDRTRITATIFSTVFAALGMIIYSQSWGTLYPYSGHIGIGGVSMESILVGGVSLTEPPFLLFLHQRPAPGL